MSSGILPLGDHSIPPPLGADGAQVQVLQSPAMRVEYASNQGRVIMKKLWLLATIAALWPAPGSAQTTEDLVNAGKSTDNVITHSMGYDRKSYSPLKQIDKSNVKRLVPVWSTSLMNDSGELAAPVIYNGVMYAINGKWTFAIDVETGRQIWRAPVEFEPGALRVCRAVRRLHQRRADDLQRQALSRVGGQLSDRP